MAIQKASDGSPQGTIQTLNPTPQAQPQSTLKAAVPSTPDHVCSADEMEKNKQRAEEFYKRYQSSDGATTTSLLVAIAPPKCQPARGH